MSNPDQDAKRAQHTPKSVDPIRSAYDKHYPEFKDVASQAAIAKATATGTQS